MAYIILLYRTYTKAIKVSSTECFPSMLSVNVLDLSAMTLLKPNRKQ